MFNLFKSKKEKNIEKIITLVDEFQDGIHEIRNNYTAMLSILEDSRATLNDYFKRLNEKEVETFNYLFGDGEQQ